MEVVEARGVVQRAHAVLAELVDAAQHVRVAQHPVHALHVVVARELQPQTRC